jgi:hypothetical protein
MSQSKVSDDALDTGLIITDFLKKRGIVLTTETQDELLLALDNLGSEISSTPKPNTKEEWRWFATHWIDGGWHTMQWYDIEGERTWYDMKEEDAFYPFDERVIIRFKT